MEYLVEFAWISWNLHGFFCVDENRRLAFILTEYNKLFQGDTQLIIVMYLNTDLEAFGAIDAFITCYNEFNKNLLRRLEITIMAKVYDTRIPV